MKPLPRIAIGGVHPKVDYRPFLWGLLQYLEETGLQTQCFYSECRFPAVDGASSITGRTYRHLDARLMSSEICREVFLHGASGADLSIVEADSRCVGGLNGQLADWLELPRIGVIDVEKLDPCQVPRRPRHLDGLFLTGAPNESEFARQRLRWETLWNVPVLGGLVGGAHIKAILDRLPAGSRPSRELVRALCSQLVLTRDFSSILRLASAPCWGASQHLFRESDALDGLRVAVAFDDAFHTYFSDTLDLLELSGAALRDFSPVADPDLPPDTDIVYLGCGHVDRFAPALAANPCMVAALRRHARSGGRVYAEGGGAAYLCHHMEFGDGASVQGCGIIPAVARLRQASVDADLVEVSLAGDCWLGKAGDQLRGYRNDRWTMEPMGPHWSLGSNVDARSLSSHSEMLCRDHVIASQVHLNLVAQPHLLASFAATANPAWVR